MENKTNVKNNIDKDLGYSYQDTYVSSWAHSDYSYQYTLLIWKNYAKSWDEFIKTYPTFNFINKSYLSMKAEWTHFQDFHNFASPTNTNTIKVNQGSGDTNCLFQINILTKIDKNDDDSANRKEGYIHLNIWHDDEKIYYKWFFVRGGYEKTTIDIKLTEVTFYSVK